MGFGMLCTESLCVVVGVVVVCVGVVYNICS